MAKRFILIAVIYLVVASCLGVFMGATKNFALASVHSHLLLAGWLSLAVIGLIYHQFPASSATWLAKLHFWLHNLGLPVFMGGLAFELTGNPIPVALPAGSFVFLLGLIAFAVNIWFTVGRKGPAH